jgi:hypothetical protein
MVIVIMQYFWIHLNSGFAIRPICQRFSELLSRIVFGELTAALLLPSALVNPEKLVSIGYTYTQISVWKRH